MTAVLTLFIGVVVGAVAVMVVAVILARKNAKKISMAIDILQDPSIPAESKVKKILDLL